MGKLLHRNITRVTGYVKAGRSCNKELLRNIQNHPAQVILGKRCDGGEIDVIIRVLRGMVEIRDVNKGDQGISSLPGANRGCNARGMQPRNGTEAQCEKLTTVRHAPEGCEGNYAQSTPKGRNMQGNEGKMATPVTGSTS